MKKLTALFCSFFLTLFAFSANAQYSLSGKITEVESGQALPGATIRLVGTVRGTTSNGSGAYTLNQVPAGSYTLRISYVGFEATTQVLDLQNNTTFDFRLTRSIYQADEVVVSATRATEKSAIAYTDVSATELRKSNLGQDLPQLLNFTPSLVSTSDAGAGVGYTGFRIRGSDATRTNVTLNGIPYNDAESQGTYFVDLPDIASSVSSIQIQRGAGTSTNGAGAFGASVNIQTNEFRKDAYAETNHSYGSLNTLKNNVLAGTGLLNGKFTVDARLSRISSDGYIDRSASDLKSYAVSGGYFGKKSLIRLNVFTGLEKTFQAWNGVPEALLKTNRRFNEFTYDNQTDNYRQDHYQLITSHRLSDRISLNVNLFYTKGRGYYEEFKPGQNLADYGLPPVQLGSVRVDTTTLIRRKWLDNDFAGTTFSLDYTGSGPWRAHVGGGYNQYRGSHFGEVIWARFASTANIRQEYYRDAATKTDFNGFAKVFYQLSEALNVFADAQFRHVTYSFLGFNSQLKPVQQTASLPFFNPKFGFTWQVSEGSTAYASYSVAQREPNRDDYTQSSPESRPKAERLGDLEAGYRFQTGRLAASVNGFWMNYQNQLVLTGRVNDVGNYTRTNAARSYRAGLELEAAWQPVKTLKINANATFSENKIRNFTEFLDNYDEGTQAQKTYARPDIAFSPNVIFGSQLLFSGVKNLELALLSKYVGRQYLDNTGNAARSLADYFTNDLRAIYTVPQKAFKELTLSLLVNNVFNRLYESNGYTFSYILEGKTTTENFYYPQAGVNGLLGLSVKF